jgi:hypothetical protein
MCDYRRFAYSLAVGEGRGFGKICIVMEAAGFFLFMYTKMEHRWVTKLDAL